MAQHVELGLAEVVADRPDHAYLVEEGRRQREVHGRAAEHPLALAERGLDRVEGDGSDDGYWHGRRPYTPTAPDRSQRAPTARSSAVPRPPPRHPHRGSVLLLAAPRVLAPACFLCLVVLLRLLGAAGDGDLGGLVDFCAVLRDEFGWHRELRPCRGCRAAASAE